MLRALRRRRGWRQRDLSDAGGLSQSATSRAELGHLDTLSLRSVRRLFAALDARVEIVVRWRGGEVDRLADAGHARLGATVAAELQAGGWHITPEVTFMRYGERGSMDVLAVKPAEAAAALFELKTELVSSEETQRRLDVKQRVLASVVEERFGWRPRAAGTFLVLADTSANRRRSAAPGLTRIALPAETRAVRQWVRKPVGPLAGIWFVRFTRRRGDKCATAGSHRVRRSPPTP